MRDMSAIVISRHGGPEVLEHRRVAIPEAAADTVLVRVRAFGLNHAEAYFRSGAWGDVARITGIECAGEVADPGGSGLTIGQRVVALMGGMGRTIDGSYAAYVRVPAGHVVAIDSELAWTELAALPESYATAWVLLHDNLAVRAGDTLLVRGGTSALGQAAINLARGLDARVLATTRSADKRPVLEALGAEVLIDAPLDSRIGTATDAAPPASPASQVSGPAVPVTASAAEALSAAVRAQLPDGVDGVLDLIGTRTLLDSLRMARYGGRVAMAGFLGGGGPIAAFDPLTQLPSGVHLSFFASAFLFGTRAVPLSRIPFQRFADDAARGLLRARPAHVFDFADIVAAHRLMESGAARGKIVVRGPES